MSTTNNIFKIKVLRIRKDNIMVLLKSRKNCINFDIKQNLHNIIMSRDNIVSDDDEF